MLCDICGHEDTLHVPRVGCAGTHYPVGSSCPCPDFEPSAPSGGRDVAIVVASVLGLIAVGWSVLRWGWM